MLIDARHLFPKAVDDPDEEITVTMTKGQALAPMDAVWAYTTDYELEEGDSVMLEDLYMNLQDEVWPEIEGNLGIKCRGTRSIFNAVVMRLLTTE